MVSCLYHLRFNIWYLCICWFYNYRHYGAMMVRECWSSTFMLAHGLITHSESTLCDISINIWHLTPPTVKPVFLLKSLIWMVWCFFHALIPWCLYNLMWFFVWICCWLMFHVYCLSFTLRNCDNASDILSAGKKEFINTFSALHLWPYEESHMYEL